MNERIQNIMTNIDNKVFKKTCKKLLKNVI